MKKVLSFWFKLLYLTFIYSFAFVGLIFFLPYCAIHAFLYLPLFGFIVGLLSILIFFHFNEILRKSFLEF